MIKFLKKLLQIKSEPKENNFQIVNFRHNNLSTMFRVNDIYYAENIFGSYRYIKKVIKAVHDEDIDNRDYLLEQLKGMKEHTQKLPLIPEAAQYMIEECIIMDRYKQVKSLLYHSLSSAPEYCTYYFDRVYLRKIMEMSVRWNAGKSCQHIYEITHLIGVSFTITELEKFHQIAKGMAHHDIAFGLKALKVYAPKNKILG